MAMRKRFRLICSSLPVEYCDSGNISGESVETRNTQRPIENYWPIWCKEAAELVGYEVIQKIMANFGGIRVYIAAQPTQGSALSRVIGKKAVMVLSKQYGGMTIEVPKGNIAAITLRNRMIAEDRKSGETVPAIARKYSLTERQIRYIFLKVGLK